SDIHDHMARSVSNLKKLDAENIILHVAETRTILLDGLWVKFKAQYELIQAQLKESYNDSEYNTSEFVEITYVQQRSLLNDYVIKLKVTAPNSTLKQDSGTEFSSKTSLPRLKLRSFSCAFGDWSTFRDTFQSIVEDNPSQM
ncbi:hypothetical protein ALC57_13580, partial [Trachymyrmex cornetzi]